MICESEWMFSSLREEKHRLLEDIATMRASLEKVTKEVSIYYIHNFRHNIVSIINAKRKKLKFFPFCRCND